MLVVLFFSLNINFVGHKLLQCMYDQIVSKVIYSKKDYGNGANDTL